MDNHFKCNICVAAMSWLTVWVSACVSVCVRKGIQNTPKNWNFFHLYIHFDIIELVTWI